MGTTITIICRKMTYLEPTTSSEATTSWGATTCLGPTTSWGETIYLEPTSPQLKVSNQFWYNPTPETHLTLGGKMFQQTLQVFIVVYCIQEWKILHDVNPIWWESLRKEVFHSIKEPHVPHSPCHSTIYGRTIKIQHSITTCIWSCYPQYLGITRRSCLEAHRS
jgi:hypothetical protein